jgi:hypothetical protein
MDKRAYLKGYITRDIIGFIIEDTSLPVDEAMNQFYHSQVFEKLNDYETKLYLQSAASVYDLYLAEKREGHLFQLEP